MQDSEFPEALQIEVTNRCNFNCLMCIRRVWSAKPLDLDFNLYRKIAESSFSRIDRLILYGFGEPFVNPNFLEMLKIAKKYLRREATISVSTNGSLLSPRVADKILKRPMVDSISFSIDTFNVEKLSRIRVGSKPSAIIENFRYAAEIRKKSGGNFKLGAEVVITKDNFGELPQLVRNFAEKCVDYILVSHVVPYTDEFFRDSAYVMLSKPPLEIALPLLERGSDIIREATLEALGKAYGVNLGRGSAEIVMNLWNKAEETGYWINLPLLLRSKNKVEMTKQVEKTFRASAKIAYEHQLNLRLPNLYPDAKDRACPYVDKNTMVIRSDGMAAACLEFMYAHPYFANAHMKKIYDVLFGDLRKEKLEDVWGKEKYVNFREIRRNFSENIPWCGDCPFSTLKCFFTETNMLDCRANAYGCSECLYSVNLAQCNL
ncbi:MAG: hypothetical protein APU95_06115 [Hadesarchaea archaeon YNP_N21]|nr:MAG: hypothetical protein APU95_06115 [Hadesarchaea archaeon YNP_N21]